jgi:hypothetical protein
MNTALSVLIISFGKVSNIGGPELESTEKEVACLESMQYI